MTNRLLPEAALDRPALRFLDQVALPLGRVHEICGGARRTLAAMLAGATTGPVLWIQPAWGVERINGEALTRFADPGRFVFLYPRRPEDLLWVMEEALRSGAVPLAVADLPAPPGLTPVRRLHLAAEAGAAAGRCRPLGLLLTEGEGGAQGAESRWHIAAEHGRAEGWRLGRRRARAEPPQTWRLAAEGGRLRLTAAPEG